MITLKLDNASRAAVLSIIDQDVNVQRGIRQGFFKAGDLMKKTLRNDIIRGSKTGRVYRIRRGKRIKNHQASAAGETAANLSGVYQKSIGYKIKGASQMEFGSSADYAEYLEKGTSRMAARPGLGNTLDATSGDIVSILESEIRKAIL